MVVAASNLHNAQCPEGPDFTGLATAANGPSCNARRSLGSTVVSEIFHSQDIEMGAGKPFQEATKQDYTMRC